MVIRPNANIFSEIVAECPFCGDKSFKQEIEGQFCLGHIEDSPVRMVNPKTETDFDEDGSVRQSIVVETKLR